MPRIVLVEEDATTRRRAAEVLAAADYQVDRCPEPGAAFACACRTQPDLVILDVAASSRRVGYRVLNQLKQQEETQAIPVLLAAPATPTLARDRRVLAERGVHLLPHPVSPSELPRWVAEILASRPAAEEVLT